MVSSGSTSSSDETHPAQVDHGHFGELLDAFGDDLGGEAAQRGKLLGYGEQFVPLGGRVFVAQGEIDVESGNVGCTRLDDLRAFQVARQRGDGAVDFLIDFDEEVVDIASLFERQTDDAVSSCALRCADPPVATTE